VGEDGSLHIVERCPLLGRHACLEVDARDLDQEGQMPERGAEAGSLGG
jgi:hypothetical protein